MRIRNATACDLDAIAAVEAECFPAAEAATREVFEDRLAVYPDHFWLLEDNGALVGFVNGMVTDESVIRDAMFENASLHNHKGAWQAIFGVDTIPSYRRRGMAAMLMRHVAAEAKGQGRKGCILTCKEHLLRYYGRLGYENEGISGSVHGGAVWYNMRLTF